KALGLKATVSLKPVWGALPTFCTSQTKMVLDAYSEGIFAWIWQRRRRIAGRKGVRDCFVKHLFAFCFRVCRLLPPQVSRADCNLQCPQTPPANDQLEKEARIAVELGHQLVLRVILLQNNVFSLGLDDELKARADAFLAAWKEIPQG